jgi:hypothetical protein
LRRGAIGGAAVLWNRRRQESAMRMPWTATLVVLLIAACKTSDAPATEAKATPPTTRSIAPTPQPVLPAPPPPAATASGARPESAKTEPVGSNTELETKGLAVMQRMADLFAADAKDCDKLGADLKAFVAENKPLIGDLLKHEGHQNAEQRAAFTRRNAVAQAAIAQKMQAALTACASNAAVLSAMKEFPGE